MSDDELICGVFISPVDYRYLKSVVDYYGYDSVESFVAMLISFYREVDLKCWKDKMES